MVWLRLSRAHHCGVPCGRPIDGALLASAVSVARLRPWNSQFQVLIPAPCSASVAVLAVYICESRVAWSLLFQAFKVHKSGVRSEGLPAARSRLLFVNSFALPLPELEWYSFSPLSMGSFWRFTPTRQRLAGAPDLTRPERAIRMIRKQATPGLPCGTVGGETIWEGWAGNTESGI